MAYPINGNKTVEALGQMHFEGNIVPHSWWKFITSDTEKRKGKPDATAILLLADIVYWYRPKENRDEHSGRPLPPEKKFEADKLQRSYGEFAEMYGLTKRQVTRALKNLERLDLIDLDFRTFFTRGILLANVLFIGLNHERLKEITYRVTKNVSPLTNTEADDKNGTADDKNGAPDYADVEAGDENSVTNTEISSDFPMISGDEGAGKKAPASEALVASHPTHKRAKRDERQLHPAAKLYNERMGLYVRRDWLDKLIGIVGDTPEKLAKWDELLHEWNGFGWSRTSILGMLEAFEAGGIKRKNQDDTKARYEGRTKRLAPGGKQYDAEEAKRLALEAMAGNGN